MKKCTKVAIWLCAAWAVRASAAPPLEVYGALPGVDQIQLSPSGQQFALFGVIDGSRKFAVFSFEGKPLFVVADPPRIRRVIARADLFELDHGCAVSAATKRSARGVPNPVVRS